MPDDFFRIRLVATLLETCGIFFNRGAAGKKLDYFLSFLQVGAIWFFKLLLLIMLQYYIYTKDPLPMDIEFIVQDLYSLLRSQWKLASNLEEAGKAFQLAMTQDQKTSGLDKTAEPEEPDTDPESEDERGDGDMDVGLLENEDGESESDSELDVSNLRKSLIVRTNNGQVDGNGDATNSSPASDSEEEEITVTREEEQIDPEDEADFEREYAKMMAESLDSRKHERKATFDVPLPMKRSGRDVSAPNDAWPEESTVPVVPSGNTMRFSLLTKRGNRQQVSHISAPTWTFINIGIDTLCGTTIRLGIRN